MLIIHFSLKKMFLLFLLSQRHIHPTDVENRPNGLTINLFIGRQIRTCFHKSESFGAFGTVFLLFLFNITSNI